MNGNSRKLNNKSGNGDCCGRRTKPEICLAITLIIVLVYTFCYMFIIGHPSENTICTHFECLKASVEIESSLSTEIDPCEKFNQFVCQRSIEQHSSEEAQWQKKRLERELNGLITSPIDDEHDSNAVQLQKIFYQSCMNLNQIDSNANSNVFLRYLEQLGGWPVLKDKGAQEDKFDWLETMYRCMELGLPSNWFLDIDAEQNGNRAMNRLRISVPNCKQFKLMELSEMVNVAVSLGVAKHNAIIQLNHVVYFEKQLADICKKASKASETTVLTLLELNEMFPKYNWVEIVGNITDGIVEVNETSEIVTNIQDYVQQLDHLLIKTAKTTQANFIIWQIITSYAPFTAHVIRHNFQQNTDRQESCFESTKSQFNYMSEWEYINKYTTQSIQEIISEMIDLILETLINRIENAAWIPIDIKNITIEKLNTVIYDIGGQSEILSEQFIENFIFPIDDFDLPSLNPIEILTELNKKQHVAKLRLINCENSEIDEENFELYPYNVQFHVYYAIEKNHLVVPAPLLHYNFHAERPMYLNYANLGSLIATELTQILLKQNETTTMQQEDQLQANSTEEMQNALENIKRCYLQTNKDARIEIENEENLLLDEFRESLGRDIAYSAYQEWVKLHASAEKQLINLESYTPNQLFWIAASADRCFDSRDVDGSLINSNYFGEDWSCSRGETRMHPMNKCWIF